MSAQLWDLYRQTDDGYAMIAKRAQGDPLKILGQYTGDRGQNSAVMLVKHGRKPPESEYRRILVKLGTGKTVTEDEWKLVKTSDRTAHVAAVKHRQTYLDRPPVRGPGER